MKVAVLNFSGNVGKTTIAAHLLSANMGDAKIFSVETVNETAGALGLDVENVRGEAYRDLYRKLVILDDAIVDVGASNVEAFLLNMDKFEDSHFEFDLFVVPCTSSDKVQKETIKTIDLLAAIGVGKEKIWVVFNRVNSDVEGEFRVILDHLKKSKSCNFSVDSAIYENEVFDLLAQRNMTISALLADPTDFKAKAREAASAGDEKAAAKFGNFHAMRALAKNVVKNLHLVFGIVTGKPKAAANV